MPKAPAREGAICDDRLEPRRLLAAAGELDPAFGDSGAIDLPLPRTFGDVLVLGDDRVLVMQDETLSRYTADGALDPTFGTDGTTTFHFDDDVFTEDNGIWLRALPGG